MVQQDSLLLRTGRLLLVRGLECVYIGGKRSGPVEHDLLILVPVGVNPFRARFVRYDYRVIAVVRIDGLVIGVVGVVGECVF